MSGKVQRNPYAQNGTGDVIDTTTYAGPNAAAAFTQPFWDIEIGQMQGGQYQPLANEGPLYAPSPWQRVQLGAYLLPGIWEADAAPAIQIDVQKPKGYDGAALITRGYLVPRITLTGQIGTVQQWATLQQLWPAIWARPYKVSANTLVLGGQGQIAGVKQDVGQMEGQERALAVIHPGLNWAGIQALVLRRFSLPRQKGQVGIREIVIEAIEYVPVPSVVQSAVRKIKGQTQIKRDKDAITKAVDARNAPMPSKTAEGVAP
jgi:hypothetical protein